MTLGAGGAAPTSGEDSEGEGSDEAADALPASATDIGSAVATGGEGSGVEGGGGEAGDAPLPLHARSGRRSLRRSAVMELLRARDEDEQDEAMLPDDVPMLLPHGAKHSRALREVRRRLREYLSEQAEKGTRKKYPVFCQFG